MTKKNTFSPAAPVRAYEAIVRQFDEAFRSGALKPGDRLPSERDLMEQFEVSRSTVREALRILQSGGLIRSRPGDPRGPEVIAFSAESLHRPMQALLHTRQVSVSELVFFRVMSESTIAMVAASRGSTEQLEAVGNSMDLLRAAEHSDMVPGISNRTPPAVPPPSR